MIPVSLPLLSKETSNIRHQTSNIRHQTSDIKYQTSNVRHPKKILSNRHDLCVVGAKVLGVETIPSRLITGGQEMLGPEATFVYNDREKNQGREHWRVNIR